MRDIATRLALAAALGLAAAPGFGASVQVQKDAMQGGAWWGVEECGPTGLWFLGTTCFQKESPR